MPQFYFFLFFLVIFIEIWVLDIIFRTRFEFNIETVLILIIICFQIILNFFIWLEFVFLYIDNKRFSLFTFHFFGIGPFFGIFLTWLSTAAINIHFAIILELFFIQRFLISISFKFIEFFEWFIITSFLFLEFNGH